MCDIEPNENKLITRLHSYYFNSGKSDTSENDSDSVSVVRKLINKYEIDDIASEHQLEIKASESESEQIKTITCKLCLDRHNDKGNYIILSCNHIYHIKCLAEEHFKDVLKYPLIDNEYFESRQCSICSKQLKVEEVMYLHSRFLSNTKDLLDKHQVNIGVLEKQMTQLKNELRTCYDYKHKLEQEREKSKQITNILLTMM